MTMKRDSKHFAVTERPRSMADGTEVRFRDLAVGDRVNGRWTIAKVTASDTTVAALGADASGQPFCLTGEPHKVVRHRIEQP